MNTADFLAVLTSLADSPLPKFFGLIAVIVVVGYVLVVLDAARRTAARRR